MKAALRDMTKEIPGARALYRAVSRALLASRSIEERFTTIYSSNHW